jgi:hypothetical protein
MSNTSVGSDSTVLDQNSIELTVSLIVDTIRTSFLFICGYLINSS